jgi:DNA topoisomerase-1
MKSKLIIIEAPGKIKTIKENLAMAWPKSKFDVIATSGLLADLPTDTLGINPDTFKITKEKTKKNRKLVSEYLKKNQENWTEIWVMTDPDWEGEHIAKQLYDILQKNKINVTTRRAYCHDLSPDGLKKTILKESPNKKILLAREARRVIDRLIPVVLAERNESWAGYGRLQVATLNLANKLHDEWFRYVLMGWEKVDNEYYQIDMMKSNNYETLNYYKEILKKPDTNKIIEQEVLILEPPKPHSLSSLIVELKEYTPLQIATAMQESYIEGRISYPRTESRSYPNDIKLIIGSLAQDNHLNNALDSNWYKKTIRKNTIWSESGHPALYPTLKSNTEYPVFYEKIHKDIEEKIKAQAFSSIMEDAVVEKKQITINTNKEPIVLKKYKILKYGWLSAQERFNQQNEFVMKPSLSKKRPVIVDSAPNENMLFERIMEYKIGRPSSLPFIINKLKENDFLSNYNIPSLKGEALLKQIKQKSLDIIKPEYSAHMEEQLKEINIENYTSTIKALLMDAGFDISVLGQIKEIATTQKVNQDLLQALDKLG